MTLLHIRKKDPVQRALYFWVPALHVAIFCSFLFAQPSEKKTSQKKLVVKTFKAPSSTNIKTQTTAKPVPSTSKSAAKPAPKIEKKTVEKKTEKPIPLPSTKQTTVNKEKNLQLKKPKPIDAKHLKELEERIAKIEAKNDRMIHKPDLTVPSTITLSSEPRASTPIDLISAESSSKGEDLAVSLIGYLQGYLQLPDVGEVQIHLTLQKDGKVEKIRIVKSESEKNKKYLEEHLPMLSFPKMYLDGSSSRSFLLTFCNKF